LPGGSGACGLAIVRDLNAIMSRVIRPNQVREFQKASRNSLTTYSQFIPSLKGFLANIFVIDRNYNAAKNTRKIRLIKVGLVQPEFTPAEIVTSGLRGLPVGADVGR